METDTWEPLVELTRNDPCTQGLQMVALVDNRLQVCENNRIRRIAVLEYEEKENEISK